MADRHDRHPDRLRVLARTGQAGPARLRAQHRRYRLTAVLAVLDHPEGKPRSHAPDYFARLTDGTALVLDCRPLNRIKPRDQAAFDAARTACAQLGRRYEVGGAPLETLLANLRWLAGYRHPRHHVPDTAAALRAAFAVPTGLLNGAEQVGDPIAVLPVLYHLLWRQRLCTELDRPLHPDAVVTTAAA
ncbi:hypothetical protein F4560_004097 [Saccharothrix ecbatanensis]|uniref:TnsA endonuclease-like protein n=1 Tax=Saccharothrix ecbatanensis TaxID=1105145 RepID=A0A7W9M1T3_9PSEU|nr:TnsA-like heteromeric transposase endonuclease subunit [Saccharothrix ecbatanensis]MBB5804329.1 hypothetical protein [Saccharothrix ecbatanensis]